MNLSPRASVRMFYLSLSIPYSYGLFYYQTQLYRLISWRQFEIFLSQICSMSEPSSAVQPDPQQDKKEDPAPQESKDVGAPASKQQVEKDAQAAVSQSQPLPQGQVKQQNPQQQKKEEVQPDEKKEEAQLDEKKEEDSKQKPKTKAVEGDKAESAPQGGNDKRKRERRKIYTGYRLENKKQIEFTYQHQTQEEKLELLRQIGHCLVGRRRFRRVQVTCSLNLFYNALRICSIFHKGVIGVHMIVELTSFQFTVFSDENDDKGVNKVGYIFRITLTRFPTEEDCKSYGYNGALKEEEIKNPFRLPMRENTKMNKKEKQPQRHREKGQRGRDRKEEPPRAKEATKQKDSKPTKEKGKNEQRTYSKNEQDRKKQQESQRDRKVQKRQKDQLQDKPKRYIAKQSEPAPRQDTQKRREHETSNKEQGKRDRRQERLNREEREKDTAYRRGETRTRGTGRVAQHNYDSAHLRQEKSRYEDRGERAPPREKRYMEEEEEW